ncbi:MAG: hypothetical protein R2747_13105 [Pyrinomonadaceae bacterium]
MNANITEIAPDVFRISTFVPEGNLQFAQFLVRDEEPLLFHTGMRALFPIVNDAVSKLIKPETLRWIGFSHFEADECGALNEWLAAAPEATAVCSLVGKLVSIDDFAARPARPLEDGETFSTGKYRFRYLKTPHVPHCWEAGLMFEETNRTLFCSDLFHQNGDVEPITSVSVIDSCRQTLIEYQQGPLADYIPYTNKTDGILKSLAELRPQTLAAMHGSTYSGNGEKALLDLAEVWKELIG